MKAPLLEGPLCKLGTLRLPPQQEEGKEMVDEITLPTDATSLHFMQAIYRDARQPMPRRMRAAVAALPFEHAKLAVTVDASRHFADRMDEFARQSGRSNVIDAKARMIETDPEGRKR